MLFRLHPLIFETGTSLTMTRIQLEFFDCYPEFLREVFVLLIMWIGRIRGVFFLIVHVLTYQCRLALWLADNNKTWSILDWNCNNNDITSKARGNNAYNLSSMYRLSIYLLLFILQKLNCCKVEFVVAEYHWRKYWTSLMIPIGYLALSRTGTPQFVHILLMALFQWAFPSHQGL